MTNCRCVVVSAILTVGSFAGTLTGQGELVTKKRPRDELQGPPFVTATAWGLADGKTGRFLRGSQEDRPLPMASLTKMMTAYVVYKLATRQAGVLDEVVMVSRFAASTGGSSAKLRQNDRVPVRQLLHGLLLPSGNDAANALAEHFGPRCRPASGVKSRPWSPQRSGRAPAWDHFIAEMNRVAAQLGMTKTRFVNPHGLDAREHRSTARDLLRLVVAAFKFPEFRKVVDTRRFRARFVADGGTHRTVTWLNTNQLLGIEGYGGVKTGTTTRAGSCLASSAVRGEDHLLLVVLNSANRNGRYVDTRNLFRWGFIQRVAGGR